MKIYILDEDLHHSKIQWVQGLRLKEMIAILFLCIPRVLNRNRFYVFKKKMFLNEACKPLAIY